MKIDNSIAAFQMTNYLFEELSFKKDVGFTPSHKYKLNLDLNVDTQLLDETNGMVILECTVTGENAFTICAKMKGVFSLKKGEDINFNKFLQLNGTTVMFPFLRSAISDLTRVCNIAPVVLPLINITNFIKEEK